MSGLFIALYVIASSSGLILLKLGTDNGAPITFANNRPHFNFTLYSVIGIILYGLSFLLYMYLISKNDLGYIIPLTTALIYVLIFVASYIVFKEVFTVAKIIGIILILLGLLFLNIKK